MHDVQQKKAKEFAFSKISETVAFWLKDFSQKVLLIAFGDGQREYFDKKGISLQLISFLQNRMEKLYTYTTPVFIVVIREYHSWHFIISFNCFR